MCAKSVTVVRDWLVRGKVRKHDRITPFREKQKLTNHAQAPHICLESVPVPAALTVLDPFGRVHLRSRVARRTGDGVEPAAVRVDVRGEAEIRDDAVVVADFGMRSGRSSI